MYIYVERDRIYVNISHEGDIVVKVKFSFRLSFLYAKYRDRILT